MIIRILVVMLLVALVTPVAPARAADVAAGSKLSAERCARCHGKTGKGDGEQLKKLNADVTPKDWTDKAAMAKLSDPDITKIIVEGGKGVGKSKIMPAYQGKLSDDQVADLVAYIRS